MPALVLRCYTLLDAVDDLPQTDQGDLHVCALWVDPLATRHTSRIKQCVILARSRLTR